jgi:hypothetical protein
MGTSSSDINATYQKIALRVLMNGARASNVIGVDVSMGLSQINAQATVHVTASPSGAAERASCEVWAGYSGDAGTDLIFKGELTGVAWEYFPGVVSLEARDLLARTRLDWGGDDREYTEQDSAAVIRNLLEAMGIPSSAAHIEGSDWTLGVVESVIAPGGRAFYPLIQEIDDLEGYRTFTVADGTIRRLRVSGNVGLGASWTYEEGVNSIKITRRRTLEGIINKCIVTGLDYEGLTVGGEDGGAVAFADNPFIPDPPRYITETIQSNLVEDDERALAIAKRIVADKNRRPEVFELEVVFNPKIQPLSVIRVIHEDVEAGDAYLVVDRVQHTIRGNSARTTITTLGGNIIATATNIPPIALFDVKLFQEGEDTGAGVSSIVVGVADGSTSTDPDGDAALLTYAWALSVDAGTVTPSSGSGAVIRFVAEGAANLVITLTVTDVLGATNELTRTLPLTAGTLYVEDLYTAEDGLLAATANGEQTWNTYAVSGGGATCLAPFAPPWGEIWGASNGHIYATIDYLKTAAVDLGQPHGVVAVTAVTVHELDTTRAWACFSDGKVYQGTIDPAGPSATWALRGTVPGGSVVEIRESLGVFGSLRATAGAGYYGSEDGGATWTLIHSFDTAWRMAGGFDTNVVTGLNDDNPIWAETGTTPSVPSGVRHLRGVTFGWRQKALYATDDAANLYATDDTLASLDLQSDTLPAGANHMIRSGNIDGVIYLACGDGTGDANGAVKWIPGTKAPFYIRKTGSRAVRMVGYGPAHLPQIAVDFVFLPFGETDATKDKWHRYQDGVWSSGPLPASGYKWMSLKIHPTNPLRWLALGLPSSFAVQSGERGPTGTTDTPLWLSEDAGATWASVDLPRASGTPTGGQGAHLYAAAWQAASGKWMLVGRSSDDVGIWWVGSNATDAVQTRLVEYKELYWCETAGADGAILISQDDAPGGGTAGGVIWHRPLAEVSGIGPYELPGETGFTQPRGVMDSVPNTRGFVMAGVKGLTAGIIYEGDYTNTDAHPGESDVAWSKDGDYVWVAVGAGPQVFVASAVEDKTGFYVSPLASFLTALDGSPSHATFHPRQIRTGRTQRRAAVGFGEITADDYQFSAYDGVTWLDIPFPIAGMNALVTSYDTAYDIVEPVSLT